MEGASQTRSSVIPVRSRTNAGTGWPGLTMVWKVPVTSPLFTLHPPISVMAESAGDPPVVSRSIMQKVTSERGMPSSSKERCRVMSGHISEHMFGSSITG